MNAPTRLAEEIADPLLIAGRAYRSRLLIGTGKYRDFDETRRAVEASGAEIVTVAIRRTNIGQNANEPSLLEALPPSRYTILPNTAGCYNADDAVRTLRLARELLDGHELAKLEVLGDPDTLYPNIVETLKAAETLVREGFKVMVYTSDDPIIARQLEELAGRGPDLSEGRVTPLPCRNGARSAVSSCAKGASRTRSAAPTPISCRYTASRSPLPPLIWTACSAARRPGSSRSGSAWAKRRRQLRSNNLKRTSWASRCTPPA